MIACCTHRQLSPVHLPYAVRHAPTVSGRSRACGIRHAVSTCTPGQGHISTLTTVHSDDHEACLIPGSRRGAPRLGRARGQQRARDNTVHAAPAAVQPIIQSDTLQTAGVVIVGGGPVGYTTAIALAQKGFKDIVVLEQASSADDFDPTKGYVFSIMPSARDVYSQLGMTDLIDVGLTRGERPTRFLYLNLDGTVKESQSLFGGMNTWIQRHRFLALLYDFIQEHHSDSVKVLFNTRVTTVDVADDGSGVTVHAQTTAPPLADNGETDVSFAGRLVVAADGANSHVRQALEKAQSAEDWKMREAPSDSAGLYVKVLPLPPCPVLSSKAGPIDNQVSAVVPGKSVNGAHPLRLGLLGIKSREEPRTANFILWPDHPFWSLSSLEEFYKYLEASFPQLDRLQAAIPEPIAQRFLEAKPLQFKAPQVCPKLLAEVPTTQEVEVASDDAASSINGCAVIILGDAAHVFPPDLGQGVNSSVLDVDTLAACLDEHPGDASAALRAYEAARLPENRALQRMMQVGMPYQYRQEKMEVQRFFHGINLAARVLLSKVVPGVIAQPVAMVALNESRERRTLYQDTLAKADDTTRLLQIFLAVVLAGGVYLAAHAAKLI